MLIYFVSRSCLLDIVGARFHCAICDSVDICSNCESAGLPGNLDSSDDSHNSSHIMIKVRSLYFIHGAILIFSVDTISPGKYRIADGQSESSKSLDWKRCAQCLRSSREPKV